MPACFAAWVTNHVHIRQEMAASAERVFAALDDHANMGSWLGPPVTLVNKVDDNGVGTVRRIRAAGLAIDEEIIAREKPRSMSYRVVRGVPMLRHHRGDISVEVMTDQKSRVHWRVEIDSALPGLSLLIASAVRFALERGLRRLSLQLSQ